MVRPDPPDYYPFRRGQKRRYRSRAPGDPRVEYTVETLSVTSAPDGSASASFRNTVHRQPPEVSTYSVAKKADGVHEFGELVLNAAPKPGDRWDGENRSYEVLASGESVTTEAGTFPDCLKVRYLIAGGDAGSGLCWYAPGVGLVREECRDEADPFDSELVKLG